MKALLPSLVVLVIVWGCSSSGEAVHTRFKDRTDALIYVTLVDSANKEYRIDYGTPRNGKAEVLLLDAFGTRLFTIDKRFVTSDWFTASLQTKGLKPGEYYIELRVDDYSYYKKPIFVK